MVEINSLKTSQHYDVITLAFCIAVLIIALVIGYFREVGTFGVETDFYEVYAIQAENILAGQPYTYQHNPPGYCLILAAVTFLTGDTFVAAKVISGFATAIFGWITYLLLKTLFGSKIAFISTTLSLLTLIPSSFVAATDIVSAVLIVLALWIFLRHPVLTFKAIFLSGIVAGIAYLVRGNAIFVSVGIIFSLISINPNQQRLQKSLIRIGVFTCGLLLVTSPWFIYNWKISGNPFASTAYLQIAAHFHHPQGDEYRTTLMEMSSQFNSLSEVILHEPIKVLRRYLQDVLLLNIPNLFVAQILVKNLQFPTYQVVMAIPLLIVSAGMTTVIWDLRNSKELIKRRMIFLLVSFLGYLLLGLVGFHRRYYFFFFPLVFLLIIYPLFHKHIFNTIGSIRFFRISLGWLLVIILSFAVGGAAYLETESIIVSEPKYLLEIADFLQSYSLVNETIITRKPHLAYLAKLKGVFPLAKTADEYLVKARDIKARYIVYSDYEASLWSGLKSLSAPKALSQDFKLIYRHKPTNTLIYEIAL